MHRCWHITANDPSGIHAIEIPEELRRDVDS